MLQVQWHLRMLQAARGWQAAGGWGMTLWQEALLFGLVSALSLPIGAYLGQWMSPVQDDYVAALVAFGAGALLFAVTVELYGHALHEVASGAMGYHELAATITCALIGALLYLYLNKTMEEWMEKQEEEEEETHESATTSGATASGANPPPPGAEEPGSASSSARAQSGWARIRQQTHEIGAEARRKKGVVTAKQALNLFMESSKEEAQRLANVAGRQKRMLVAAMSSHKKAKPSLDREKTQEEIEAEEEEEKRVAKGLRLAHAMFLGLLVDGVPESILLGFLAAERSLSLVLVLSLFVANFPEAFSSASLMKEAGIPVWKIVGMWSALCVLTGVLAALACAALLWCVGSATATGAMPFHIAMGVAMVEGIAGGAMIACIASVMLPEAFARKNKGSLFLDSGFLCTAGFLLSVLIKVTGGVIDAAKVEEHHDTAHDHVKEHVPDHHHVQHNDPGASTFVNYEHELIKWGGSAIVNWGLNQANATFLAHVRPA